MRLEIDIKKLLSIWTKVAANSFGGPAGQIAVMHKEVVENEGIISEDKFLQALNFCMLLPGPEAQQLATYIGFLMDRWRGGLIAGGLFILPGFLSILFLSYLYVLFGEVSIVQGMFYGMKPAIISIVIASLIKISKKSLKTTFHWIVSILAFTSLFFLNLAFPIVVISAGVAGMLYGKFFLKDETVKFSNFNIPPISKFIKTVFIWIVIWVFPIVVTTLYFGIDSHFHRLNLFFSKMSLVTFGGAYAALSYVAQEGVEVYGWLQSSEMLDGLALAETTPGPLIQVVQHVGFMGSYNYPGSLNPLLSAFLGAFLTTWMTFVPCFLFIFSFAPYVEYISDKKVFSHALSAITAAVVGVILNLSLWFMFKTLFKQSQTIQKGIFNFDLPLFYSIDFYAVFICLVGLVLCFKFKREVLFVLFSCTILGVMTKVFL